MAGLKRVCVFCGSALGLRPEYARAAETLGSLLAARGIGLVFGGGNVGLMGVLADAALGAGGEVVGVIPRFMTGKEAAHTGVTRIHFVETMHERKAMMERLADGFITLPGGIGTFEECCEMLAWSQLGLHPKPCGLLNVAGYYDPMIAMLDRASSEGFIKPEHRRLLTVSTAAEDLLRKMESFEYPFVEKWLERGKE